MKCILNRQNLKLNIGCGPNSQFDDFINIDNSPSVLLGRFPYIKKLLYKLNFIDFDKYKADWTGIMRCDVSRGLPFDNESVDKIYSSHFLEHIPYKKGQFVLKECFRVLKKNGVMRLIVPDLLLHAERYVGRTHELLLNSNLPSDKVIHDDFLNTIYGAYLKKKRYGLQHCYMYDLPTLVAMLKSTGFTNIQKVQYRQGTDKELASNDSRPEDSLHLEITK